ncbi:beta-1,4-glucuronyltransferase 1 [Rhinatrema bivittatum]|uniref:beta-1,4-glucuronyltransferase 1 n=1 Tax=Rhinatrema bivittatum TaxID=194408 RepID=UPI001126FBC9|nr:beta-1,4-glucuronyltransferase 1 [Rhinatrema bivittatum]
MLLPRKCSFFKVVVTALLLVALLQLIYLSLLSRLHGRQQQYKYSELFEAGSARKGEAERYRWDREKRENLKHLLASGGMLDASGQYRLYRNLVRAASQAEEDAPPQQQRELVLATHATLNNLHYLRGLVERWRGPLSLALFAPSPEEVRLATLAIYALTTLCMPVRELVSFHLVCHSGDLASFPELEDRGEFARLRSCAEAFGKVANTSATQRNYALGTNISYPNNLLRNVARMAAAARFVLVTDMDMLPSEGLRPAFLALAAGRREEPGGEQAVFAVPAFEIRHARKVPVDKAELLQLYQVGEIRPFYEELCPRCQAPTNYSHWLNLPAEPSLRIAYTVAWKDPWEPFYIGPRSVPAYDERFKQYGFNRISQACELHVSGHTFHVLDNAFLVHQGFKVTGEFHAQKEAENQRNRALFRQFKQELKQKYPLSSRRC